MTLDKNTEVIEGRLIELKDSKRALLLGIYKSGKDKQICLDHLEELHSLCDTYGLETIDKIACPLKKIDASTYLGKGKVQEISEICENLEIDIIVFDEEIAPHQQKNLEKIFKKIVIDRTELILGVFALHAQTKEAKLQVKLAATKFQMPRLKRMWTHLSRQRTGGAKGGFLKGAGERQIEIDRQTLKKKISDIQKNIDEIKKHRLELRKKRKKTNVPTFAIVGYTNAGKSTLMNALTNANVLVEDKLFATLDTTTRRYFLPNRQQVLLIDTVGFIRKLPHSLIAAFKSTLEEAMSADILLHLIDVKSPYSKENTEAAKEVLKELNAENKPTITCLNKIDELEDKSIINYFKINYPKTVEISALKRKGFEELLEAMTSEISNLRKFIKLQIPQSYYKLVSEVIKKGRIISSEYIDNDIVIEAEIPSILESKLKQFIIE